MTGQQTGTDETIKSIIDHMLDFLQVTDPVVTMTQEDHHMRIAIDTPDAALLIGMHGATLEALEHLLRILVFRYLEKQGETAAPPEIRLDVGGYRNKQVEELTSLALRAIEHVRQTGQPEVLRPMNAYERRLVHMAIADQEGITTESIGSDPNRRVVIKPKTEAN